MDGSGMTAHTFNIDLKLRVTKISRVMTLVVV